ncbi:hypothetical protein [Kordia sp.]|uniref:hypothetical protein n=1 Tax=Kordia sp. TaxID=1965332 RepID=UPI003D283B10
MENLVLSIVPLVIGIAIGYFLFKKLNTCICENSDKPDGIIPVSEAVKLHESYVNGRYPIINQFIDKDFKDTQFVWFEYDKMKSYIQYLEAITKKNPNNPKISGVRVYFGAYTEHPKYPKQQTVFFNPTIETSLDEAHDNMKNLPFYIIPNSPNEPLVGQYKIIERLLIDEHNPTERAYMANNSLGNKESKENLVQKKSANAEDGFDDGTSVSFNIGHLSPPPPKG